MRKTLLCCLIALLTCGFSYAQDNGKVSKKDKKQATTATDTTRRVGDGSNDHATEISEGQEDDSESSTSNYVPGLLHSSQDVYTNNSSYTFSIAYFRARGLDNKYQDVCLNGFSLNSLVTGRATYSQWGGLNHIFRYPENITNMDLAAFSFGDIGGATNYNLRASNLRKQVRATYSLNNRTYNNRLMLTGSTGVIKNGWAVAGSLSARFGNNISYVEGTHYNSFGGFFAAEKQLNSENWLNISAFASYTDRGMQSNTVQEAYDLLNDHYYNSNWGWYNGEKRNARVKTVCEPVVLLTHTYAPKSNKIQVNTTLAATFGRNNSTSLNWYDVPDPRPDYYRYLPSYQINNGDTGAFYNEIMNYWLNNDESYTQINWDKLYYVNYLNNYEDELKGTESGATYSVEKRHSNQATFAFNTNLNTRLNDKVTFQGGANASYTRSTYYKTMDDLMGGKFWLDVDQYAERDFPENADMAQNDLDHPNRKVKVGERFGYDYDINTINAGIWNQMVINLAKWDFNYSLKASYTSYQRDGHMRNGRAPENSLGKGEVHTFVNAAVKAGVTFKLDGRNSFRAHIYYGNRAPLANIAYVSPHIKDDVISNLKSENIFSGDISYTWNYRSFQGVISAFYTDLRNGTERYSYYDDQYSTFMNYALTNVHKVYKGVELGLAYKLTPSITLSGAMNLARYQYKNRPTGTRSYENGTEADITKTVYLKNFYVSGTPQEAYSLSLNWAAPKMWFFELTGTYMDKAYIDLSPIRHEQMDELYKMANTEEELVDMMKEISKQEKLNSAFVLGASIGHVIYLNRRSSLNFNLNVDNILNNRKIMTGGYQQGRFDYKNYTTGKFPNKIYYAQGIKVYLNVGIKF